MRIINHIGVSGGKDSTALLLWAKYESGYDPSSLDVTFCDTGNEHPITYDYVQMLSDKVHPIRTLKPERDFYELAKWKKRFPGARSRFCTIFLKIKPSNAHLQTLLDTGAWVVMHSGVRANESKERAKLVQREELRERVTEFRPLLRWTLDDVWAIHKRHGIDPNPLYSMGAKRVGCLPCIMSRKAEVANIATRWPERIDMIREKEQGVQNHCGYSSFFPRKTVPLRCRSKKITTKDGRVMMVCTIDDVVQWATELKPTPDWQQPAFNFELNTQRDDATACQSTWGACE